MRRCTLCGLLKDSGAFAYKHRNRCELQSRCRQCFVELARTYYARDPAPYKARARRGRGQALVAAKLKLREYLLKHPCVDCGQIDLAELEFDHVGRKRG